MGLALQDAEGFGVCAVAQDFTQFDALLDDLEAEFGDGWGGLDFADAQAFLKTSAADSLQILTLGIRQCDEQGLPVIADIIAAARARRIKVILIVDHVSPACLHRLLREGADDFVPYPPPKGALHEAVSRLMQTGGPKLVVSNDGAPPSRNGVLIPVYGLVGGAGASVVSVNLAWELAQIAAGGDARVCILDFDLQFGAVSTYLNLPRREAIFELLSDVSALDCDAFKGAMLSFEDTIDVFTAPSDSLPLEILGQEDVEKLLGLASALYDFVIVDLPAPLVSWSEAIINRAEILFAVLQNDLRSAQNALRFMQALQNEDLPLDKVRYLLNKAPKPGDIAAQSRLRRMAENVGMDITAQIPDGGAHVVAACDQGLPLARSCPKNPARKELLRLADAVWQLNPQIMAAVNAT